MRLIDADKLRQKFINADADGINLAIDKYAIKCIDEAQTADVEPVKHGKWIKNDGRHGWHCSACGEDDLYAFAWNSDKGENELQDRYCPNCGTRMDGDPDA